eukprot:542847_1
MAQFQFKTFMDILDQCTSLEGLYITDQLRSILNARLLAPRSAELKSKLISFFDSNTSSEMKTQLLEDMNVIINKLKLEDEIKDFAKTLNISTTTVNLFMSSELNNMNKYRLKKCGINDKLLIHTLYINNNDFSIDKDKYDQKHITKAISDSQILQKLKHMNNSVPLVIVEKISEYIFVNCVKCNANKIYPTDIHDQTCRALLSKYECYDTHRNDFGWAKTIEEPSKCVGFPANYFFSPVKLDEYCHNPSMRGNYPVYLLDCFRLMKWAKEDNEGAYFCKQCVMNNEIRFCCNDETHCTKLVMKDYPRTICRKKSDGFECEYFCGDCCVTTCDVCDEIKCGKCHIQDSCNDCGLEFCFDGDFKYSTCQGCDGFLEK